MAPEGWRTVPLGEAATLQRGFDLPVQDRREGTVPVVASNGPVGTHRVAQVNGPGVVTGRSGTIGKVFYYESAFWPLNTTLYVSDFHGNHPGFIARLLSAFGLEKHVASTGVPSLNRNFVHPLPVLIPPLAEQRKIAAILSSLDDAIEATQAVIDQLVVVKKAMMAELLTRGLPGRHTRFKMTEIGEVPESWNVAPMARYLREPIRNGYSPVCPAKATGKWVLHLGAVTFDGFNAVAAKPAPLHDASIDSCLLASGDLLVSRSNTRERVGLAGLYLGTPTPCSYPDLLMRVRTDDRLKPEFLETVLLAERARRFLSGAARGTSESMVKINRDILSAFVIPIPPRDEQDEIVAALDVVHRRRVVEREARNGLLSTKAALMSVLLTGEVRVTPDEEAA